MHIDTRKEDISVDYLLRGIQHRIRNNKGLPGIYLEDVEPLENIDSLAEFKAYDNIHISPELYFNLDYASKLYDPRTVPGNTRFYKVKKLIMRVFRLYATRQVEFNAAILKITNRFFDLFHDIAEKFEYFRKAEVRIHQRIEQSEKIERNISKRLDNLQSRLEFVEDFGVDISFLRRRLENVESFEREIYLVRQRIESLENWEKDFNIQRSRIEKLESWEEDFNIQRNRIEKLETWEEDFNIQRKRIEKLETWEEDFNNLRDRIEDLENWEEDFNIQRSRIEKLETWEEDFNNLRDRIEDLENWEEDFNIQRSRIEKLENWEKDFNNLRDRIEDLENWDEDFNIQRNRIEKLENWEKDFNNLRDRIEKLETWDDKFNIQRSRIEKLETWEKDFNIQRKRFEEMEKTNRELNKRLLPLENIKERFEILLNENTVLRQRLEHSIVETRPVTQTIKTQKSTSVETNNIHNDYLYFPYLNTDRTIESVVKKLIEPYVSFFSKSTTNKNIANPFVIDIGCGRGEFLDVCRKSGVPAKGIDINEDMVRHCKAKKHDIVLSDAVSYLKSLENNSVKGIFACHVIEHMRPNQLLEFLRLCSAKLSKGGKLALETPNPTSFFALSMFYRDFTHKQPIHPKTISFLLEKLLFQDVKVEEIHPTPEKYKLKTISDNNLLENTNIEKLNNTLYGYLDYSVLATK